MATTCIDKILCENAWECNITVCDTEGNPIDPLLINDGDSVIFVVNDRPGYSFIGWVDENGRTVSYTNLGNNRYRIDNILCSKKYYAKFRPIVYTIKTNSDSASCQCNRVWTRYYGDIVEITACTNAVGCHFLYWKKDDEIVSEQISFQYVVTENVTFTACYDVALYTLTVKPSNPNRGTCTGGGNYPYNTTHTIEAIANDGYIFSRWDDGDTNATRNVTLTENRTYIAYFSVDSTHIVVTRTTGGSTIGEGAYKTGSTVSLQAIPDNGYKFDYWVIDGVQYTDSTFTFIASGDKTIIPYFSKEAYYLTTEAKPNGYGYFDPSPSLSYEYGDIAVVEAKPNTGYKFVEWSDNFTNPRREVEMTSNIELAAYFTEEEQEHTLTVELPDSTFNCAIYYGYTDVGTKNNNEVTANGVEGTLFELAPVPPAGKEITSVTKDGVIIWDNTSRGRILYTMGDSDATLVVNAATKSFNLRASITPINNVTSGNVTLMLTVDSVEETFTPTAQNPVKLFTGVDYGTSVSMTAPSSVGNYNFAYWRTDVGSYNTETITFNLTQETNCYAVYDNSQQQQQQEE